MREIAIKVQGLSKEYSIGLNKSGSFRESFSRGIKHLMGEKVEGESFLALNDISFEVKKGEAVGIIGRNGAGKSTLLKILSRITEPTKGRIEINGRVSSLLEVGTGFHPELTGRENIYLNGTILGMTRREVKNNFDEIVDFSGVEKFIDTPVKHYSSGMKVRLAFSVAAHLDPEILIIDEVLAVGDASFQRKCVSKMEDTAVQGRTVLFVSHNLSLVQLLCSKGILLENGYVKYVGDINRAISKYSFSSSIMKEINVLQLPRVGVRGTEICIKKLVLINEKELLEGDTIELEIEYLISDFIDELVLGFSLSDATGKNLLECRSTSTFEKLFIKERGLYKAKIKFSPKLHAGIYNLNLGARCVKGNLEYIPSVMMIEILPRSNDFEEWNKPTAGLVLSSSEWHLTKTNELIR